MSCGSLFMRADRIRYAAEPSPRPSPFRRKERECGDFAIFLRSHLKPKT
jgi:hypothetical protein